MTADDVLVKQNSRKPDDDRQIARCEAFCGRTLLGRPWWSLMSTTPPRCRNLARQRSNAPSRTSAATTSTEEIRKRSAVQALDDLDLARLLSCRCC